MLHASNFDFTGFRIAGHAIACGVGFKRQTIAGIRCARIHQRELQWNTEYDELK